MMKIWEDKEKIREDAKQEAYRLLLQEALRVEYDSEDIYVHFGKVPEGSLIDPIPIDRYLDICVPTELLSPETILLLYTKCREAVREFNWGVKYEHH
tara:strand:- start:2283 stop:2573 length:291 start_codon:yes stop_codon:yes gene_type:complete